MLHPILHSNTPTHKNQKPTQTNTLEKGSFFPVGRVMHDSRAGVRKHGVKNLASLIVKLDVFKSIAVI